MNTPVTLTPEEEQQQDDIINDFMYRESTFSLLLDWLEVETDDEDAFSDAIYWALWPWIISGEEFKLIQKYMWNNRFNEKFWILLSQHQWKLEKDWFTFDVLQKMSDGISHHVDMILDKFDIYNHIWKWNDNFYKHYGIIAQSKYWDVIVSKDFSRVYLFTNNCFFNCDNIVTDGLWGVDHFLWYFPDHAIHLNMKDEKIYKHPWKPVWFKERWDLNALHSVVWDNEVLTILETELRISKSRKNVAEWKTQFLDIMRIWEDRENIIVKMVDAEVVISWWTVWEEIDEDEMRSRLRAHIVHKLYSLTDEEEIFSTRGEIKDIIVTAWDTYIIYETEEYHPEKRESKYLSKTLWVYSIQDHSSRIEWIPVNQNPVIVATHDNLLIINDAVQNKYIYSCRDQSMVRYLSLWETTHYHIDGERQVNIEFIDEDGKAFHDSRDDCHHWEGWVLEVERNYN